MGITSAVLSFPLLFEAPPDSVPEGSLFNLFPLTRGWSDSDVDWDRGWETAGGDFEPSSRARARLGEVIDGERRTQVVIDVTGLMKTALEEGHFENGFIAVRSAASREISGLNDAEAWSRLGEARLVVGYKNVGRAPLYEPERADSIRE